jgi:dolichol-phosphate mannosyltransferase
MACVSLIVPVAPGGAHLDLVGRIAGLQQGLRAAGHAVELLAVVDPEGTQPLGDPGLAPPVRMLVAGRPGKAAAAFHGLREASGEFLVVLDLEKGYGSEDLDQVIGPLLRGEADVVVASRRRVDEVSNGGSGSDAPRSSSRGLAGILLRPLIGIADPSTGLVAFTRSSYQAREDHPVPLGSRFVLEILVGAVGRRIEVPLQRSRGHRQGRLKLTPSDIRLFKRLADDRFGNFSRLFQFCAVGASGMVIDLSTYALLQLMLSRTELVRLKTPFLVRGPSLDLAVAGALAIAVALVWNFSLNRRLTFNDARQSSLFRQFVTYALSNALGIALSFSLRLILPTRIGFFQRHKLAAAVVGIVAATGISFSMSRWVVFHRRRPLRDGSPCHPPALAERV